MHCIHFYQEKFVNNHFLEPHKRQCELSLSTSLIDCRILNPQLFLIYGRFQTHLFPKRYIGNSIYFDSKGITSVSSFS